MNTSQKIKRSYNWAFEDYSFHNRKFVNREECLSPFRQFAENLYLNVALVAAYLSV